MLFNIFKNKKEEKESIILDFKMKEAKILINDKFNGGYSFEVEYNSKIINILYNNVLSFDQSKTNEDKIELLNSSITNFISDDNFRINISKQILLYDKLDELKNEIEKWSGILTYDKASFEKLNFIIKSKVQDGYLQVSDLLSYSRENQSNIEKEYHNLNAILDYVKKNDVNYIISEQNKLKK